MPKSPDPATPGDTNVIKPAAVGKTEAAVQVVADVLTDIGAALDPAPAAVADSESTSETPHADVLWLEPGHREHAVGQILTLMGEALDFALSLGHARHATPEEVAAAQARGA